MKINSFQKIYARIYLDYFSTGRFEEYDNILSCFCANQYKLMSVIGYYDAVQSNKLTNRVAILRHNIDTEPQRAKMFLNIERKHGSVGSYYFRFSTLDLSLINEIEAYGGEASYHYEEIASFVKHYHLYSRHKITDNLENIRNKFIENYSYIKQSTGLPMRSVASHCDFVNKKLGLRNTVIMSDEVRRNCGIDTEAYDSILKNSASVSDRPLPLWLYLENPLTCLKKNQNIVYLRIYSCHWEHNFVCNFKAEISRVKKGIVYKYYRVIGK